MATANRTDFAMCAAARHTVNYAYIVRAARVLLLADLRAAHAGFDGNAQSLLLRENLPPIG